jgi:hypothetical protein
MYCITNIAFYIGIRFEVLSYGILYKCSLVVYCNMFSFPCMYLMFYSGIVFINLLFVFYCHDSFFTVAIDIVMTCSVSTLVDLWNNE